MLFNNVTVFAKEYSIFSISQEFPMGEPSEKLNKNYYVDIGSNQGVKPGTLLTIFRRITTPDPYSSKTQYHFKVEIGELEVLHSEEYNSIAQLKHFGQETSRPILLDINAPMIGDRVNVKIK